MRISIGLRLFAAILLSMLMVGVVGLVLIRWTFQDGDLIRSTDADTAFLDDLVIALSPRVRDHGDWSFVPDDARQRRAWLYGEMQSAWIARAGNYGSTTLSPGLFDRIGLLDREARPLAGSVANRLVIAVASIDTIRRPLLVGGKPVGYLVLARPQNPDDGVAVALLIERQDQLLLVLAAGVLLSALMAAMLAVHFRRPIRLLADASRRLESGELGTRLAIRRSDELGVLAGNFNKLAVRLDDMDRSRRQWVADTSHELRTPLAVLHGQIEALQDGVRCASPENVELMLRQVRALSRLVEELNELARADAGQWVYTMQVRDVWQLVHEASNMFMDKFQSAGLAIFFGATPVRALVQCDEDRINQVLVNLFENCVRYTAAGGRVEIHAHVDGKTLRISIDDTPPTVPATALPRLGERFFRVEVSRNRQMGGAGLGLALCKRIVEAHEGRLEFAASPLGGLRVTMVLRIVG